MWTFITINQNLSFVFHCVLITNAQSLLQFLCVVGEKITKNLKRTCRWICGLTADCFPPRPTHWASRVEVIGGYHEYTDVKSCQDVVHLYHLLWSATILNIVALFLGIITAAVLGGFKDMVRQVIDIFTGRNRQKYWEILWKFAREIFKMCNDAFISISWLSACKPFRLMSVDGWIPLCQTPSTASESSSEPEAITAPVLTAPPPHNTSLNSYYNTAPCLPPYTAYDLQVQCCCVICTDERCHSKKIPQAKLELWNRTLT